jgi:predicted  nucleic acid-binding Zn-ribbon protein
MSALDDLLALEQSRLDGTVETVPSGMSSRVQRHQAARAELAALRDEVAELTVESEELDDLKSDITSMLPYTEDDDEEDRSCLPAAQCVEAAADELASLRQRVERLREALWCVTAGLDPEHVVRTLNGAGRLTEARAALAKQPKESK